MYINWWWGYKYVVIILLSSEHKWYVCWDIPIYILSWIINLEKSDQKG